MPRAAVTDAQLSTLTRQLAARWRTVQTDADAALFADWAWTQIDALQSPRRMNNLHYWLREARRGCLAFEYALAEGYAVTDTVRRTDWLVNIFRPLAMARRDGRRLMLFAPL